MYVVYDKMHFTVDYTVLATDMLYNIYQSNQARIPIL